MELVKELTILCLVSPVMAALALNPVIVRFSMTVWFTTDYIGPVLLARGIIFHLELFLHFLFFFYGIQFNFVYFAPGCFAPNHTGPEKVFAGCIN